MKTGKAADCATMAEVRAGINRIDADLVALLAERMGYIDRAAEIKPGVGMPARVVARVEDVVSRVRASAAGRGLDPDLAEALWRQLIEWSIAREERIIGSARKKAGAEVEATEAASTSLNAAERSSSSEPPGKISTPKSSTQ